MTVIMIYAQLHTGIEYGIAICSDANFNGF